MTRLNDALDAAVNEVVDAALDEAMQKLGRGDVIYEVLNRPKRWEKFKDCVWEEFERMTVNEVRRYALQLDNLHFNRRHGGQP